MSIKNRKSRRSDELRNASNHLYYEFWMLKSLVYGMVSGIAGEKSVINNALLESFIIHARVLLHFLYPHNTFEEDVVADNFFSDPNAWENTRPPKSDVLQKAQERANKEVAHLSYSRQKVDSNEKEWEYIPIFEAIRTAMEKFLKIVPKDLLGDRWNNFKQRNFNISPFPFSPNFSHTSSTSQTEIHTTRLREVTGATYCLAR